MRALVLGAIILMSSNGSGAGAAEAVPVRSITATYDVSYLASYKTTREWEARARELREHILVSCGLAPMPERCPLNARVFGKIDRGDYTVEKVYFESLPAFYVTGNLYRPKGDGPFPAVLNPHGHWKTGRLANEELGSIPGRCVNLAKQGYVAFTYDMIGYNDSKQLAHTFGRDDDRLKLWGISLAGLQLWNSIRSLDFLESLPDVDRTRIACTGASGGGTQTFLLTAVDDRVKVAAPVNMISAHMQGGCLCENAPNLRVETDSVEIGAMAAPRPLLMVSATGDWTMNTLTVEYPAVKSIYRLLGAEDHVSAVRFDAPHNYNKDSREAVYSWFGKWLPEKPLPQPVVEEPFEVEKEEDLLVFAKDARPPGDMTDEKLVAQIIGDARSRIELAEPADGESLRGYVGTYLPVLRQALLPYDHEVATREFAADGKELGVVVLVHSRGLAAVTGDEPSKPGSLIRKLNAAGRRVVVIEPFSGWTAEDRKDINFFDAYNRTDTARRVCDIVAAVNSVARSKPASIELVGMGEAGLWCLLARPFVGRADVLVADVAGFDGESDEAFVRKLYVPNLRQAGDLKTAIAACAPGRLVLHNAQGKFDASWAKACYAAAGNAEALRVLNSRAREDSVVGLLVGRPR